MDGLSRLWRRVLVAWVVAVAVGGGLTLWLRDSGDARAPGGAHWQRQENQDTASACPRPTDSRYDDPRVIVVCVRGG
ncbi:hypothetical protein [Streptomyces prunicolor]|uniref:Secreted protein n=1 Tax=Streptomyces prunicolor TaxID=67348 RepID=A0ABU4FPY2_9ACTN|nr:hypothetical protein [Streptomyces prunicolor]MDV7222674.1 hypothetical protein [Streptomyces prunicolor]